MDAIIVEKLSAARNLWVTTVRPDGRPHLTPVWFTLEAGCLYICISSKSVKARNLENNPRVACALEDGDKPVICEGTAHPVEGEWPEAVLAAYKTRFDWDLSKDSDYDLLIEIRPEKWLHWND